jgi:sirohydrochlorin cobaltochelatase
MRGTVHHGIILFAHGARDPRWAEPLEASAAALRRRRPDADVRLAYLDFLAPTLPAAAESMIAAGCRHIDIVPLFLGGGGHVRRDLPEMVGSLRDRHPDCRIALHAAAGETLPVIEALAQAADELTR